MAKNVALKDLVNDIDPDLKKLLYTDFRTELDSRPTILDITYNTLKINNPRPNFKEIHDILLEVVKEKAVRQYTSIEHIPANYFNSNAAYIIYINGDANNKFLIAKSARPIRVFISEKVSKDKRLVDSLFGQRKLFKELTDKKGLPSGEFRETLITNVDIGHISSAESPYLVSPLEEKILSIIEYGEITSNARIIKQASNALNDLYSIQAEAEYTFKNTAPDVMNAIGNKLGEFFVVVTLHTSSLNQEFSAKEKKLFTKLEGQIALLASKKLRDKFLNISGSNTVLQDVVQGLQNVLKTGKPNGLKAHTPRKVKTATIKIPKKVVVNSTESFTSKSPKLVSNFVPLTYSLANLQQLINDNLERVISGNMGSGGETRILNYKTGRFAASARVERMSESRAGMITAFYSYMKNPYQTFEPGYKQGSPQTRDPKLLIAKSIREIAATKVGNRLRAVSIWVVEPVF